MAETYRTTLRLRRGQAEVWERNNPVLQEGEPGFALDTRVLKIGDGVTPWLELKGIDSSDENYDDIISELESKMIGKPGSGQNSEIFNNPNNIASGVDSHAEGRLTKAINRQAHAEGDSTLAGNEVLNTSQASPIGDYGPGAAAHAEGIYTNARGAAAHSEGYKTQAVGNESHAEGLSSIAMSPASHAEGESSIAYSTGSHAEGKSTSAGGHVVNNTLESGGSYAHSEGVDSVALGRGSHAEGESTLANNQYSHAEGGGCQAYGDYSHAEGCNSGNISTTTYSKAAHAEGIGTWARGEGSHTEGKDTQTTKNYAHAEGEGTVAGGIASHSEGKGTKATGDYQHAQGKYNVEDTENKYAHIVGGGTESARKNIHALDWQGNAWFAGNLKIGGTGPDDPNAITINGDCENSEEQAQSDWEMSDSTNPAYIKNRPFYDDTRTEYVVEPSEYMHGFLISEKTLVAGETYDVEFGAPDKYGDMTWQSLQLTAKEFTATKNYVSVGISSGETLVYIGNLKAIDSGLTNTGEDFCIYTSRYGGVALRTLAASNAISYQISVGQTVADFKALDEKFIPKSIARAADIPSDEHINSLINLALGVIENGTY